MMVMTVVRGLHGLKKPTFCSVLFEQNGIFGGFWDSSRGEEDV